MTRLKKIKPSLRLAEEVYEQLCTGINSGLINPDERIVQERLADELQVSRTPVREALIRLEHEGILVRDGRVGFVIRKFTEREIAQIYSAREAVECHSLGLLCDMNEAKLVKRLFKIVEVEENRKHSTLNEFYEANKLIHRTFVKETGNRFLLDMFDQIWNRRVGFVVFSALQTENLVASLTGHSDLCEAVERGDKELAIEAMRSHIHEGMTL